MSYEFVSKSEYTPVRVLLEEIISEIQKRNETGIYFSIFTNW